MLPVLFGLGRALQFEISCSALTPITVGFPIESPVLRRQEDATGEAQSPLVAFFVEVSRQILKTQSPAGPYTQKNEQTVNWLSRRFGDYGFGAARALLKCILKPFAP